MTGTKLKVVNVNEEDSTNLDKTTSLVNINQSQLVFDIFNEYKDQGKNITESDREIGYAKHNFFIDSSDQGLLSRRVLNACHYIVSTEPTPPDGMYCVKDDFFRFLINYDSNNLQHLRTSLRLAQKAAAEVTVETDDGSLDWRSVQLVGATALKNGHVYFTIPPEIEPHIKNPSKYTYLSIRISTAFTSSYTSSMYEFLLSKLFQKRTEWIPIDDFVALIGAKSSKIMKEFRYLNRDILKPGREQINELSDILIEYETKAVTTRKVSHIRFTIEHNTNGKLNLQKSYKEKLSGIYKTLTEDFGLSKVNLDEIMAKRDIYTDDRIQQAIDFTRLRLKNKKNIEYPGLYFMKILRENLKISTLEAPAQKPIFTDFTETKSAKQNNATKYLKHEAFINALSAEQLDDLIEQFKLEKGKNPENEFLLKQFNKDGLKSLPNRNVFYNYLEKQNLI